MPLAPVSRRELVARLHRLGFTGPFAGGKHEYLRRDSLKLRIPNPHEDDIGVPLLRRLLRQAGLSEGEWENAR